MIRSVMNVMASTAMGDLLLIFVAISIAFATTVNTAGLASILPQALKIIAASLKRMGTGLVLLVSIHLRQG